MAPSFDAKNMPFRQLGSSGLRVPVFSLGGCACARLGARREELMSQG
jgi:hypothetical protein